MLVVDLMHEFELGVWKWLFIHLLRILRAVSGALLNELDHQYVCPIDPITVAHPRLASDRYQRLVGTQSGNFGQMFLN